MWTVTYGGVACFGSAVRVREIAIPDAGGVVRDVPGNGVVEGVPSMWAGGRGYSWEVRGLLIAPSIVLLNAAESALVAMADGQGRSFGPGTRWLYDWVTMDVPSVGGVVNLANGWVGVEYKVMLRGLR